MQFFPMMGRNDKPQKPLFYAFNLDDLVPQDHLFDHFLDLSDLHEHLAPYYSHTGRPSVDPELMIRKLIGDTAYGTAEILGWIIDEKGIEPHVPVWERAERKDGTFSRSDFSYDAVNDEYSCPGGKKLKQYWTSGWQSRSRMAEGSTLRYHALKKDCQGCALKEQCCPNTLRRKVTRSVHEAARDVARAVAQTPDYRRTRRQRKQVEMLFAHMKWVSKMDRLRLRGLKGAQDEFLLTATAQNLRRMVKYLGTSPAETPEIAR
jgi:hypothetical protein